MESGLPNPEEATNELTSIALHDSATNQYWVLVMDKDGEMREKTTDKLSYFLSELKRIC